MKIFDNILPVPENLGILHLEVCASAVLVFSDLYIDSCKMCKHVLTCQFMCLSTVAHQFPSLKKRNKSYSLWFLTPFMS